MGVKSVLKVNICLIWVIQSIYTVKISQFWLLKGQKLLFRVQYLPDFGYSKYF